MNKLSVREIQFYERDVRLRMPFRFGVITLRESPQVFLRLRIALENGREDWGVAAELLAPKWFDKNTDLSNEENYEQLRTSLRLAVALYTSDKEFLTPFALYSKNYPLQISECQKRNLNPLIAAYGPALLDRAILDALCRLHDTSFYQAVQSNLPGMERCDLLTDFSNEGLNGFLESLRPRESIHARHTVGLVDPITEADLKAEYRVNDGLPETLEEVIATYGNTYFKLKVAGQVENDVDRLRAIAAVLDRSVKPYYVSLDGNEQFHEFKKVEELWDRMEKTPSLRRLMKSIVFVEQPLDRMIALQNDVSQLGVTRPLVIDESDNELDAFPRARHLGYRGVSSKTCKGIYKSIINAARCAIWNEQEGRHYYFMTGEDLSTQPGIALQQDLALVSILGIGHLERNGHHYVRGLSDVPRSEQKAFLDAHSDLYTDTDGFVRVHIQGGRLVISSLSCAGFGTRALPHWDSMREAILKF